MKGFSIARYRSVFLAISAVLVILSASVLGIQKLNLGIDFTGGTLLERNLGRPVTADEVRQALVAEPLADLALGNAVVQPIGERGYVLIRTRPLENTDIERIDTHLAAAFGASENRRTEMVGPVIGSELVRRALLALALASVLVLIYITLRFESYKFGVAAIAAVVHDVLIALAVLSILGTEINSPFVAAILTVVGYSLNDTIVIFDRVRENLRNRRRETIGQVMDKSIRQSLARTINTSVTTLFVLVALLVTGSPTISDFVLPLIVGVLVGTYSTIFLASPLWAVWREREETRSRAAAATT